MYNTINEIQHFYDYTDYDEINNIKVQTIMIEMVIKNGFFTNNLGNDRTNFVLFADNNLINLINKANPIGLSVTTLLPESIIINVHFPEYEDISAILDFLQI